MVSAFLHMPKETEFLLLWTAELLYHFAEIFKQGVFIAPRSVDDACAVVRLIAGFKPFAACRKAIGVIVCRRLCPEAKIFEEGHALLTLFVVPTGDYQILWNQIPYPFECPLATEVIVMGVVDGIQHV